jgi:hypothetical protein
MVHLGQPLLYTFINSINKNDCIITTKWFIKPLLIIFAVVYKILNPAIYICIYIYIYWRNLNWSIYKRLHPVVINLNSIVRIIIIIRIIKYNWLFWVPIGNQRFLGHSKNSKR